jgi:hypothetical protein
MRDRLGFALLLICALGAATAGVVAWRIHGPHGEANSRVWRSVDPGTGQTVIAFNAKGFGAPDTWCFLKGTQLVRMEFDENADGVIDRWEYYGSDGTLDRAYELDAAGNRRLVSAVASDGTARPR